MTDAVKPSECPYCDFSSGTRGMDRCGKCAGTGSVFVVKTADGPRVFPNTKSGYVRACEAVGVQPEAD